VILSLTAFFCEKANKDLTKKGEKQNRFKNIMAPPKGLEPLTDWLTASRST
jgi:hypothetical protein